MQNRVVILQVAAAPHFIHSWREALTRANTGSVCSSSTTQSDGSSSPRTTHHNSSLPMIATNSLTEMLPQTHSFHPFQPLLKEKRQKNFYLFFSRHSSVFSRYNPCSLLLKDCLVVQWVEYWVQLTVYTTRLVYEVIFHCGSLNTVHHKALSTDCEKKLGRLVSRSKLWPEGHNVMSWLSHYYWSNIGQYSVLNIGKKNQL